MVYRKSKMYTNSHLNSERQNINGSSYMYMYCINVQINTQ